MNRSMFKTLGRIAVALTFAMALATTTGCKNKGCEPCKTSKNCKPGCSKGCDKPCDKKVADPCPAGCTKSCCKKT